VGAPLQLLILGTGAFAREVADLASDLPELQVVGFVASTPPFKSGDTLQGLPVYWVDELGQFAETHAAVCALATTQRWQFVEQANRLGMRFVHVVHPTARISRRATLGEGVIVSAGVVISNQSRIGDHVILNRGVLIGHDNELGPYCTVGPGANLAGNVRVGARTWIGMGALVIEKISVGSQAVIGAGALVISDVPDRVQVVGSPARVFQREIEGR
jgi:sugar O-acyltransferase (sialic acid O-acetyltransferase NeuD family)